MRQRIAKLLIAARFGILLLLGIGTYILISVHQVSLWWILAAGAVSGVIFGKVFCRWVCPMGIMMEMMMTFSGNKNAALLQYHKVGCPIAWVSGWMNRRSLFGIRRNAHTCTACGLCDSSCYIARIEPDRYSLYKEEKAEAGKSYTCSRCLQCVAACPNGSLRFTPFK